MSRNQLIVRVIVGLIGIGVAALFLDEVGGAIGWMLAGATLAVTLGPSFRTLYAWSTARQLRRDAEKRDRR